MAKRKAAATKRRVGAAKRASASRSRSATRKTAAKTVAKKGTARKRAIKRGGVTARKRAALKSAALKRAAKPVRRTAKAAGGRKRAQAVASRKRTQSAGKRKRAATAPKTRPRVAVRASASKPAAAIRRRSAPAAKSRPAAIPVVRKAPGLDRERRTIADEDIVQTPPSSLDLDRTASSARSGRRGLRSRFDEHTETGPAITGGDVDADWESAYTVGDEAPGGDNPTPDQDIVDDIGRAVGVEYQDNEELKGDEKIAQRDRKRWELDPASSDDYEDR